jgi:hypothetical protein
LPGAALAIGLAAVLAGSPPLWAGDDPVDIDRWHAELAEAAGPEPPPEWRPPALGLYPTLGVAAGPPNWFSGQGNVFVSYSNGRTFSLFGGYGVEWGPQADAQIITLGWGGVRVLPAAAKQRGFHGKYLRYRRWDDTDHGIHHGLSVGTIHGLGNLDLSFEMGAARSEQNHWLITLQVSLKLGVPVYVPLSRPPAAPGDDDDG